MDVSLNMPIYKALDPPTMLPTIVLRVNDTTDWSRAGLNHLICCLNCHVIEHQGRQATDLPISHCEKSLHRLQNAPVTDPSRHRQLWSCSDPTKRVAPSSAPHLRQPESRHPILTAFATIDLCLSRGSPPEVLLLPAEHALLLD